MFLPAVHSNWPAQFWQATVVHVGRIRKRPDIVCVQSFAGYFTLIFFPQTPHLLRTLFAATAFYESKHVNILLKVPQCAKFTSPVLLTPQKLEMFLSPRNTATNLMKIILDFNVSLFSVQLSTFFVSFVILKCLTLRAFIWQTKCVPTPQKCWKTSKSSAITQSDAHSFYCACLFSPLEITDCQKEKKRLVCSPNSPEIWALYEDMAITYHHQKVLVWW